METPTTLDHVLGFVTNVFTIFVDETKTVEEVVEAGDFHSSDKYITSENFPKPEGDKKEAREILIFHFNKNMSPRAVFAEMDLEGYKPATIWDLGSLSIQEPNLQKEFQVVALNSVCELHDERYAACLCEVGGKSKMDLQLLGDNLSPSFRFAAVPK